MIKPYTLIVDINASGKSFNKYFKEYRNIDYVDFITIDNLFVGRGFFKYGIIAEIFNYVCFGSSVDFKNHPISANLEYPEYIVEPIQTCVINALDALTPNYVPDRNLFTYIPGMFKEMEISKMFFYYPENQFKQTGSVENIKNICKFCNKFQVYIPSIPVQNIDDYRPFSYYDLDCYITDGTNVDILQKLGFNNIHIRNEPPSKNGKFIVFQGNFSLVNPLYDTVLLLKYVMENAPLDANKVQLGYSKKHNYNYKGFNETNEEKNFVTYYNLASKGQKIYCHLPLFKKENTDAPVLKNIPYTIPIINLLKYTIFQITDLFNNKYSQTKRYEPFIDEASFDIKNPRQSLYWKNAVKFAKNHKDKLDIIHSNVKLKYGNMNQEFNEQVMAAMFLDPDDVVLELGGNVGRNSITIACLLNDEKNLVTLEPEKDTLKLIHENRDLNGLEFYIESAALSKIPLMQKKGVNLASITVPLQTEIPKGYEKVDVITLENLKSKYKKDFTALAVDCEGAFYNILKEFPEILEGVFTVIIENDFKNQEQKDFVDNALKSKGFINVYTTSKPFFEKRRTFNQSNFYQVWKKNSKK